MNITIVIIIIVILLLILIGIYWYCKNKGYIKGGAITSEINGDSKLSFQYDRGGELQIVNGHNVSNITANDFLHIKDPDYEDLQINTQDLICHIISSETRENTVDAMHHTPGKFHVNQGFTYKNNKFYIIGLIMHINNGYFVRADSSDIMEYDYDDGMHNITLTNKKRYNNNLDVSFQEGVEDRYDDYSINNDEYEDYLHNVRYGFYHTPIITFGTDATGKTKGVIMTEPGALGKHDRNMMFLLPNKRYDYVTMFYYKNNTIYVPSYNRFADQAHTTTIPAIKLKDYDTYKMKLLTHYRITYQKLKKSDKIYTNKHISSRSSLFNNVTNLHYSYGKYPHTYEVKYDGTIPTPEQIRRYGIKFDQNREETKDSNLMNSINMDG